MNRLSTDTSSIAGAPAFVALKAHLIELTGLAYYVDRNETLVERLQRRLAETKIPSVGAYFDFICSAAGGRELDALINEITVGETYFFRYPAQFDALRKVILPERIAARQAHRSLKIWSAGCASGAEPYSLAILLQREWPELARSWPISILGTDISERRLERARQAAFSEWELRGLPEELRQECFRREGSSWRLVQRYAQGVEFRCQNLMDLLAPGFDATGCKYDLILCRNVLIYFGAEVTRQLLAKLHDMLSDGGWLLVGHAEPYFEISHFLTPVSVDGATAYRRLDARKEALPGRAAVRVPSAPAPTPFPAFATTLPPEPPVMAPTRSPTSVEPPALPPAPPPVAEPASLPEGTLERAWSYANNGDWDRAQQTGERYTADHPLDPDGHFILALVHEHRGNPAAAMKEFRQVIYLDRSFALAHFHLGRLLALQGDSRAARRSYENVVNLLSGEPSPRPMRGGEGLASDDIASLARRQMAKLAQ